MGLYDFILAKGKKEKKKKRGSSYAAGLPQIITD
jgi:hypothetical protein